MNYLGDLVISLAWALPCGIFPYSHLISMVGLLFPFSLFPLSFPLSFLSLCPSLPLSLTTKKDMNYLGDLVISLAWALPCGLLYGIFPYSHLIFMVGLLFPFSLFPLSFPSLSSLFAPLFLSL
jgi:hypothetical protein